MKKIFLFALALFSLHFLQLNAKDKLPYIIMLNPAHGNVDNGYVTPQGATESELTIKYVSHLKNLLSASGFEVVTISNDIKKDKESILEEIYKIKPDMYLEIHFNASPNAPAQKGIDCWVGQTNQVMYNKVLGKMLGAELYTIPQMTFNGVNANTIKGINQKINEMPCVSSVLSLGYLTHPIEKEYIISDNGMTELCNKIHSAIIRFKEYADKND